jgi:hypothetical protein
MPKLLLVLLCDLPSLSILVVRAGIVELTARFPYQMEFRPTEDFRVLARQR